MATRIGLLAQELSRTNPWWRDPRWALTDPDLREAQEAGIAHRSKVLSALTPGCVYVLRGPRRVGKTVAVKQQIEDLIAEGAPPTAIVRVAADNMAAKELRTVVQNTALPVAPRGSERVWFFDEISSVAGDWAKEIKWLRDNDPPFRAATVVLTGSNATALTSAAGQLAGSRGRAAHLDRGPDAVRRAPSSCSLPQRTPLRGVDRVSIPPGRMAVSTCAPRSSTDALDWYHAHGPAPVVAEADIAPLRAQPLS